MRYIAVLLFILCFTAPAYAQTPAPATSTARVAVTGWRLECNPANPKLSCRVLNEIVQSPGGSLVIGFTFSPAADGATLLTMQVPLGTSVSTPVGVSTSTGTSQKFPFLTCSQQGCYATGTIEPELLSAMRAGTGEVRVTYTILDAHLSAHAVTASLSLAGFAQVYDSLK